MTKHPRWCCLDCGLDTIRAGHYYMVSDHTWAASGCAPNAGMLCLACLERRISRPLSPGDFTAVWPSAAAWQRHLAARDGNTPPPEQLEIWTDK